MNDSDWSPEWLRGVLSTCTLAVLSRGSAHGYSVVQQLRSAGISPVKGGALYPVLARLEQDGLLKSEWHDGEGGPGRKVYTLTKKGAGQLDELRLRWKPFALSISSVLGAHDNGQHDAPDSPENPRTEVTQ